MVQAGSYKQYWFPDSAWRTWKFTGIAYEEGVYRELPEFQNLKHSLKQHPITLAGETAAWLR
jgi:hypothetical protein